MGRKLAVALLVLPLLAACSQGVADPPVAPASVTAELGREFELKMGQTARLSTVALRLTLRAITEDSRCPIDVVCVWQGNARAVIEVQVGEDGPSSELRLNTGVPPMEAQSSGVNVRLVGVLPAARSTVQIRPDQYSVLLVVTR
jgi:hypothetical protein